MATCTVSKHLKVLGTGSISNLELLGKELGRFGKRGD